MQGWHSSNLCKVLVQCESSCKALPEPLVQRPRARLILVQGLHLSLLCKDLLQGLHSKLCVRHLCLRLLCKAHPCARPATERLVQGPCVNLILVQGLHPKLCMQCLRLSLLCKDLVQSSSLCKAYTRGSCARSLCKACTQSFVCDTCARASCARSVYNANPRARP